MKLKLHMILSFLLVVTVLFPINSAAEEVNKDRVRQQFIDAISKSDQDKLRKLVLPNVKIPEIREDTPIKRIQGLPSSKEDTMVFIGYFGEEKVENSDEGITRIAFIWEVTVTNNRVSNIAVVSDAANPFMNELKATKTYRSKYNKTVLVPSYFPNDVTHVKSNIIDDEIAIKYKSNKSILELKASQLKNQSLNPKNQGFDKVKIKNSNEAYIHELSDGYQIDFVYDDLHYSVCYKFKNQKKDPKSKNKLIQVVNSMFR
ncbi:hypothetical protein [Bacillus pinisoli]|uniref:hypothetical protein n=1 Tax=Bacillus pinisoli TaxID=2901866 RepID=UPI001FF648EE|nr:hypothetical protein [Bacillus pinisoli]